MAVAGIDVGSLTTKVVIMDGERILGKCLDLSSEEVEVSAQRALDEALKQAGLKREDLTAIVATGSARKSIGFATKQKTTLSCLAKGMSLLNPSVRTLFDVGAETSSVLRLSQKGLVEDSVGHDRCASGTGVFLQAMAKLMMMSLEDFAKLSLTAQRRAEVSTMCAIFAEQEVISHVHRVPPTPKNEIVAGIHGSMAVRLTGLGKRIGIKGDAALTGGVARNPGFARALEEEIDMPVIISEEPELVAAIGAARSGMDEK
ncbi:MAG: acyl-CoA dehydratase activase [Dehalococcoidia bacterium]